MLSNIGKEKMERSRSLSDRLLLLESEDVARERASVYQTLM